MTPLSVLSCVDDISPTGRTVTGSRRVAEALARRLSTSRGDLFGFTPDEASYGINLVDMLQATLDQRDVARLRAAVQAECLKDPRVDTAHVTMTFEAGRMVVTIRAYGDFGRATLVANDNGITINEAA